MFINISYITHSFLTANTEEEDDDTENLIQRQVSCSFFYRWREVSTSEWSKFLDVLGVAAPLGHKLAEAGLVVAWKSACFPWELSPRESEWSSRAGLWLWGRIVSCGKDGLLRSKRIAKAAWSESENSFNRSFSSLFSLSLSSCLNLSCKRAIEELTAVESPLCLPIRGEPNCWRLPDRWELFLVSQGLHLLIYTYMYI